MSSENQNDLNQDVEIKDASAFSSWFPSLVILGAIALAYAIFYTVFADGANFQGGDNANDPLPGNYFGIIFKGGAVIPLGMSFLIMAFTFAVERLITVNRAIGKGSLSVFVTKIRRALRANDLTAANEICDQQQGSVANVIKAGLHKYAEMEKNTSLDMEKRKAAIQTELEESTALELPMLEKNLPIIATLASIGVLVGLIGTVLGMIRAFAAMANAGAPDASALATGISEALVNTALGITTSTVSIIFYNYFTTKIDTLTFSIEEAGYSIVQTFDATHE